MSFSACDSDSRFDITLQGFRSHFYCETSTKIQSPLNMRTRWALHKVIKREPKCSCLYLLCFVPSNINESRLKLLKIMSLSAPEVSHWKSSEALDLFLISRLHLDCLDNQPGLSRVISRHKRARNNWRRNQIWLRDDMKSIHNSKQSPEPFASICVAGHCLFWFGGAFGASLNIWHKAGA